MLKVREILYASGINYGCTYPCLHSSRWFIYYDISSKNVTIISSMALIQATLKRSSTPIHLPQYIMLTGSFYKNRHKIFMLQFLVRWAVQFIDGRIQLREYRQSSLQQYSTVQQYYF